MADKVKNWLYDLRRIIEWWQADSHQLKQRNERLATIIWVNYWMCDEKYMYIIILCVVCVCASRERHMAESAMEGSLRGFGREQLARERSSEWDRGKVQRGWEHGREWESKIEGESLRVRDQERMLVAHAYIYIYILMVCRREKAEFGHGSIKQIRSSKHAAGSWLVAAFGSIRSARVLGSVVGGRASSQN